MEDFKVNEVGDGVTPPVENTAIKDKNKDLKVFLSFFSGFGFVDNLIAISFAIMFFIMLWFTLESGSAGAALVLILGLCALWAGIGLSGFGLIVGITVFAIVKKKKLSVGFLPTAAFVTGIVAFLLCWGAFVVLIVSGA